MKIIGYVRRSTHTQEISPVVQAAALHAEAARQGWTLEVREEAAASGKSMDRRPVLAAALEDLRLRKADGLAVSKLDRLSRSMTDFSRILDTSRAEKWTLISLDLGIDTSTITGTLAAHVTMAFAEMERKRIGERVREGMGRIKVQTGKHMGRPAELPREVRQLISELHASGLGYRKIASELTARQIPTARGGLWYPATVAKVHQSVTSNRFK